MSEFMSSNEESIKQQKFLLVTAKRLIDKFFELNAKKIIIDVLPTFNLDLNDPHNQIYSLAVA
jgi:hypothetical protein